MLSSDPDYVPSVSKEDICEALAKALDFLETHDNLSITEAEKILLELYEKLEQ